MTEVHRVSFGEIAVLQPDLAEVVVDEGVELDMAMVKEYHAFLFKHLQAPFRLLINKKNPYTYTFEAQLNIASLEEMKAIAVVVYSTASQIATDTVRDMQSNPQSNLRTFSSRDEAMAWLHEELEISS